MEGGSAVDAHAKDTSTISKGQNDLEDSIGDGVVHTKDAPVEVQEPVVQTTEALLAQLIGIVSESNKLLRDIAEHNQRQEVQQAENEKKEEKRDEEQKRQMVRTTSLQTMSSGSIIAVFIASLDAALLSYAHDVLSDRGGDAGGAPVKFTDKFAISCWFVSLLLAIIVVLAGSFFTFTQTWSIFMGVARTMGAKEVLEADYDSEDGQSQKSAGKKTKQESEGLLVSPDVAADAASTRSQSRSESTKSSASSDVDIDINTQVTATLASVAFNAVVVPSLLTLVVGIFVFAWAEQPRLTSISMSVFLGLAWFLILAGCMIAMIEMMREERGKEGTKGGV